LGLTGAALLAPIRGDNELNAQKVKQVLLLSIDGMHAVDFYNTTTEAAERPAR
jgi:hypothetical protein